MKRSRFDADYERVRRKPPPPEFPDAESDLFVRERAERVAAANADFRERMAALSEIERKQAAERKLKADANTQRANALALKMEYEIAGLTPPFIDGDGTPMCSLSLLLQLGWSIERVQDTVTLIRPRFPDDRPPGQRSRRGSKPATETPPDSKAAD